MSALQFDSNLEQRIAHPSIRRQTHIAWLVVAVVLLALAGGALVGALAWFRAATAADQGLVTMSRQFINALQQANYDNAVQYCVESDAGSRLVEQEDRRVKKPEYAQTITPEMLLDSKNQRLSQLQSLRDQAASEGLEWQTAAPLAFVGVRASVFDPLTMTQPAVSVTGLECIGSGDSVYGIELTARQCANDAYIITGIWGVSKLDVGTAGLKGLSKTRYDEFLKESAPEGVPDAVQKAKRLYVPLNVAPEE